MISATSLNSTSTHSLSKPAQIPLGLENGRLRVDSQKTFLVPSLPVSSRVLSNDPSGKRRERSILNGTAHPSDSHNHTSINGLRRSYNGSHPTQLHSSPRKDVVQSPHVYNGESNNNGLSSHITGGMPIPCSSPSPGSSASPNKSHSPSSSSSASMLQSQTNVNGTYQPQLPQHPGLSEFAAASRLYPGGFHGIAGHHPATAHLGPFYAAAAAAATHSLPYPLFGAHTYNHLDNFHSNLLTIPHVRSSPSPSPPRPSPSSYLQPLPQQEQRQQQQQQHSPHLPGPQTTSTTSLHNQLIESVGAGERYNGHNHNHMNNHLHQQQQHQHHHSHHQHNNNNITSSNNNSRFSNGGPGVSKGPVGIGNGISNSATMSNLPPPSSSGCQQMSRVGAVDRGEGSSDKSFSMASSSGLGGRNKVWIDLPSPKNSGERGTVMVNGNGSLCVSQLQHQQHMKEMEMDSNNKDSMKGGKEGGSLKSLKHYILTRSPDHLTTSTTTTNNNNCVKNHKNHHLQSPPNGLHHHHQHQHQHQQGPPPSTNNDSTPLGILVDSNTKLHHNNNNHSPFLPPSPKKRSGQWNFAVPNSKTDLVAPPQSNSHSHSLLLPPSSPVGGDSCSTFKYLSNNTKNPSNNALTSNSNCSGNSSSQMNHDSPNDLMTCSSPSSSTCLAAQQFHFQFPNLKSTTMNSNSPQGTTSGNQSPAAISGYMSAPSTPTLISTSSNVQQGIIKSKSITYQNNHPPIQVEQMPLIDAFRRGSLTQLANGDRKPVEDLSAEDFTQAAAILSDSISIVHCTVVHIESNNAFCKVTLSTGSHNQQVIVDASAEQPFFVLGRGWSSPSPAKTEKKLQLSCTPLCIGDVCITLTRTPNPVLMANTAMNMPAPKSNSVKQTGSTGVTTTKGTNSNSGHNNSPKSRTSGGGIHGHVTANSSPRLTSSSSNSNNSRSGRRQTKPSLQSAMLPPPTPPQTFYSTGNSHHHQQQQQQSSGQPLSLTTVPKTSPPMTNENDRPSSPKRRRWSAPDK